MEQTHKETRGSFSIKGVRKANVLFRGAGSSEGSLVQGGDKDHHDRERKEYLQETERKKAGQRYRGKGEWTKH